MIAAGHMPSPSPVALHLDAEALRPLVRTIVAETLEQIEQDRAKVGSRLAYSEAEAAALLGLAKHQLRDERRRGSIKASIGPKRKILYSEKDLRDYLASRRWEAQ